MSNEFGHLASENKYGVELTKMIEFTTKDDMPLNKKVTYGSYQFDHRPLKPEPNRCCLVVCGDKLEYISDPSNPAVSILEKRFSSIVLSLKLSKELDFCPLVLKTSFLPPLW